LNRAHSLATLFGNGLYARSTRNSLAHIEVIKVAQSNLRENSNLLGANRWHFTSVAGIRRKQMALSGYQLQCRENTV